MRIHKFSIIAALAIAWGTVSALAAGIEPGVQAPDFSTLNQDGKQVTLSQFKGKPVLLFFYPKDDTPGCTKEVCQLRDRYDRYKKLGVVILGVSSGTQETHQKFRKGNRLEFDLLLDDKGTIAALYGVTRMPIIGLHHRQSVLVAPSGKVLKFYPSVDPKIHADEVLADLEAAMKQDAPGGYQ